MKISFISDTHQHHNKLVFDKGYYSGTDVLVHCGDFTYHGELAEVQKFLKWYGVQNAKNKLLICGNHEVEISKQMDLLRTMCDDNGVRLLHNSHTTINGVKFFGSPYSPEFGNWAFGMPDDKLQDIWDYIDPDVDVLITHGPAHKRLDWCANGNVGSKTLASHIDDVLWNLKVHASGHIHESRGVELINSRKKYLAINASNCGIPYTNFNPSPIICNIKESP